MQISVIFYVLLVFVVQAQARTAKSDADTIDYRQISESHINMRASCPEVVVQAKAAVTKAREFYKSGTDMSRLISQIDHAVKSRLDCISYSSLGVTGVELDRWKNADNNRYDLQTDITVPDKCPTANIDLKYLPENRNKGDLGWCFAYASSDILSFAVKERVSAYDLAVSFHLDPEHKLPEIREGLDWKNFVGDLGENGGYDWLTLKLAIKSDRGVCAEKDFRPSDGDWESLSNIIKYLGNNANYKNRLKTEQEIKGIEAYAQLNSKIDKILEGSSDNRGLYKMFREKCKPPILVSHNLKIKALDYRNTSKVRFMDQVDKLMDDGKPGIIDLDGDMLVRGKNYDAHLPMGNHDVTVIGRRFDIQTRRCEYLIRNSWGRECETYPPSLPCSDGNVWVPRSTIARSISHLTWL